MVHKSIFNGATAIIPMADIQHIERHWFPSDLERTKDNYRGIKVVTKRTKWNTEIDDYENNIYLPREEGDELIKAFCVYRNEVENLDGASV